MPARATSIGADKEAGELEARKEEEEERRSRRRCVHRNDRRRFIPSTRSSVI